MSFRRYNGGIVPQLHWLRSPRPIGPKRFLFPENDTCTPFVAQLKRSKDLYETRPGSMFDDVMVDHMIYHIPRFITRFIASPAPLFWSQYTYMNRHGVHQ